jgi:CubicO group peptidase (beta-lactamase class C family)
MKAPQYLLLCLVAVMHVGPALHAQAGSVNAASSSAAGSVKGSREQQVDAVFKAVDTPNTPGASVAVIANGQIVLEKGYGIANLEYGIPIKPDTIFHVASVSKQFTAMAILLLEEERKLSIDDDIHKVLPELPDYGYKITIRNLLQHTSGIRDQWQTLGLAGWSLEDVITQDQILRMLFRQKELNFPPGTRFLYSNGGFTLLAEIVTRVSGEPFPQFCSERIFAPLGMVHTHFHQDLTQLVPNRAYSYSPDRKGFAAAPLNYANVGATSLFTTAGDLVRWLDNFRDPKVGGAAAIARIQERGVLADGTKIDYGLGISVEKYRGLPTLSHSGGDAGYRSEVLWFPEQQLGVAVVSNLGSFNPDQAARAVAAAYIGDKMAVEPKVVEPKYIKVNPEDLEAVAGVYPLPAIDLILTAVVEQGKLMAAGQIQPPLELRPIGPKRFYSRELQATVEFLPRQNGGMGVKITQPGGANQGERLAPADAAVPTDLVSFTGVYWSDELETQYTFFVRGGTLIGLHAHHGEFPLIPTIKDQFSSNQWYTPSVKFTRDAEHHIVGVTLGGGRVTGVQFTRRPGGTLQKASLATASVPRAVLAAIVGRYDYGGPVLTVTEDGDHLYAQLGLQQKFEIFPKSESEFFWKVVDAHVTFVRDPTGKVISATHFQNGSNFSAPRMPDVAEISLVDSQTDPMLGDYQVRPSVTMTISREAGRLYSQLTDQPKFELGASSASDLFLKQFNVQLTFVRDARGRVTGVISHQEGKDQNWPKLDKP